MMNTITITIHNRKCMGIWFYVVLLNIHEIDSYKALCHQANVE